MNQKSIVVIGAGLGGIAAAAHLAQRGLHVTVLEKNSRPGGRCDRISRDGHHFDTGPTLFIMPHVFEDEFASLGASLHDMLHLHVVTAEGEPVGEITEIIETGANYVYVVHSVRGEILVPDIEEVVLDVDPEARQMTIRLIDGLV